MSLIDLYPTNCRKGNIRLLTLLPVYSDPLRSVLTDFTQWEAAPVIAIKNVPIICTLEETSLKSQPVPYLALSYMWGDQEERRSIHVNDVEIWVTIPLKNALSCLQREWHPVRIWVDALCIDQTSDNEKSAQVGQMCEIYQTASSVIAWLGLPDGSSEVVMDAFNFYGEELIEAGFLDLRKEDYIHWDVPGASERVSRTKRCVEDLSRRHFLNLPYQDVKVFSERSYWSRAWIVQEVSVARKGNIHFICGTKQLSFDRFVAGFLFFSRCKTKVANCITEGVLQNPSQKQLYLGMAAANPNGALGILIGTRRRYHQETGLPESFMDLLIRGCVVSGSNSSYCQATDPRDKIYALWGLSSDRTRLKIEPNYSKTVQQVYTDATRTLIKHGHTDLLAWCQQSKNLASLPSWVPDFSFPVRDPCGGHKRQRFFSASGQDQVFDIPENPDLDQGTSVLGLHGVFVDTIEETGASWTPGLQCNFDHEKAEALFQKIEEFCNKSRDLPSKAPGHPQYSAEAVWRVPCADLEYSVTEGRRRATNAAFDAYSQLRRYLAIHPESRSELHPPACQKYVISMEYLHERSAFFSSKGYVGLVPSASKAGDLICIMYGAITPFVLRRRPETGYQLIGEAYVHGIMDGEFPIRDHAKEKFYLS